METTTSQKQNTATQPAGHTPGPWIIDRYNEKTIRELSIYSEAYFKNVGVCTIDMRHAELSQEYQANARLIAAAPELLEALKAIEGYMDVFTDHYGRTSRGCDVLSQARAAIARATGQA